MKVLNLYAGIGGNRKKWTDVQVTAVENNPKIAGVYRKLFPHDEVFVGDAHQYLLDHHDEFDFIWSSPPCQSHSRMAKFTRHNQRKYPDLTLYEEVIFLSNFFRGQWIVENVKPYYKPLMPHNFSVGRHLFWSNINISSFQGPKPPKNFINLCNSSGSEALKSWLGIHYEGNLYYGSNHCPSQVLRNCVHPDIGENILNQLKNLGSDSNKNLKNFKLL